MADYPSRIQPFDSAITGDCEADPVPALWDEDEDYITSASLLEKMWMPVSVVVVAGWAGFAFLMFELIGWWAAAGVAGVALAGSAAAVGIMMSGSRADKNISMMQFPELPAQSKQVEEHRFSRAA